MLAWERSTPAYSATIQQVYSYSSHSHRGGHQADHQMQHCHISDWQPVVIISQYICQNV